MHRRAVTRRASTDVADERAARRARHAAPRRVFRTARASRRGLRGGNRRSRAVARAIRPETRFGKTGFRARWTDGIRRTQARAVAARRASDGIDVANTLFALEVIPRASRGSETRPGRPSRRRARRSARARSANPKHALASRPSPPRSLERARRGDGAGMAISETGDVRVPSCVTLTTTSRAAPARRIEGRRTARPAYLGIIIRSRPNAKREFPTKKVRTHSSESRLKLGGLKKPSMPAYFGPDFVNWVFR